MGEGLHDCRIGIHHLSACQSETVGRGAPVRFDVDVVEHFEVVGRETLRDHHDPLGPAGRGEVVDHFQEVRPSPRFGRAAGALPRDSPPRPTAQVCCFGDRARRSEELVSVGVVEQRALGKGVSGEDHLGPRGHRVERRPQRRRLVRHESVEVVPLVDVAVLDAALVGGFCCPLVVLADRRGGVVGGEHQPDDAVDPLVGEFGDGVLDERPGVLLAEHDVERPVAECVEGRGDSAALRLSPLRHRGEPSDRRVPIRQIGELVGGRRTASTDVGVVGLDVADHGGRAVGHDDDAETGTDHRVPVGCS